MKTKTVLLKKTGLLLLTVLLLNVSSFAATFTAIASGNWSSSSTWGVSAPSPNITLDQVIIPMGITVTMDNSVSVSGALATLDVSGTLSSAAGMSLTASTLGTITGMGSINVGTIVLNTGANLAFTGSLVANTITSAALTLQVAAEVMANQTLNLSSGTLSLNNGGSIDVANNSTIVVSGGVITLNGGTIGLNGTYNVSYTGGSAIAGAELTGSGLNNVTVNVSSGNSVTLSTDLFVDGTLSLSSGTLVLNGNDLTITGDVSASGSGNISALLPGSNISVSASGGVAGSLNFTAGANTVNNFTVNVGGGNQVQIGGTLTIDGALQLSNGTLNFSGASLTIDGTVSGTGFLSGNTSSDLTVTTAGGLSGGLAFAGGGQAVNNLTIAVGSGNSVMLGSNLTVAGTLALSGGSNFDITGDILTVGGDITGSGSLIVNSSSGLVLNTMGNVSTDLSLSGTIGDFTVNIGSGNNVMLGADLTVSGVLTLQSGTLVLNGNDFTIAASGDVAASGSGSILSGGASDISIGSSAGVTGVINFSGSSMVNNLSVSVGASSEVYISGSLTVDGALALNSGTLNFSNGNLTISGTLTGSGTLSGNTSSNLTVNSAGGLSGALNFAASGQVLNNFTVAVGSGNSVTLGTPITINGDLDLNSGTTLNISGQSVIIDASGDVMGGGTFATDGLSSLTLASSGGVTSEISLSGVSIGTLNVNVGSGNNVTLGTNTIVSGTLNLQSGTLVLNGYDLTINGNIAASGSGNISTTGASDISVNTGFSPSGSLSFAASGNTAGNFNVAVGSGGSVDVASDFNVSMLNFTSGSVNIGSNNLEITAGGIITGAGSSSYVITGNGGSLSMQATAGGSGFVSYPIGTNVQYSPAGIQLNSGSNSGTVSVGVTTDVHAEGNAGADISDTESMVDATWNVTSDISSNLNLNLQVMWNTAMEVNGFNHNAAYISHYVNGDWDTRATAAATAQGSGMYSLQLNNLTSLSPFAVFDNNTATSIKEVSKNIQFEVFPNPASSQILVKNTNASTDALNVDITNVIGQVVASYRMTDTELSIPVSGLFNGNYFIRLYNNKTNVVKKFTKI